MCFANFVYRYLENIIAFFSYWNQKKYAHEVSTLLAH